MEGGELTFLIIVGIFYFSPSLTALFSKQPAVAFFGITIGALCLIFGFFGAAVGFIVQMALIVLAQRAEDKKGGRLNIDRR